MDVTWCNAILVRSVSVHITGLDVLNLTVRIDCVLFHSSNNLLTTKDYTVAPKRLRSKGHLPILHPLLTRTHMRLSMLTIRALDQDINHESAAFTSFFWDPGIMICAGLCLNNNVQRIRMTVAVDQGHFDPVILGLFVLAIMSRMELVGVFPATCCSILRA